MQHIWYVYIDGYTTWAIFILQITEVTLIHFGKVSRTTAIFVYNFFLELIIGDFIQSFFLSSVVCCPDRSGCTNSTEKISIPAKICLLVSFCSLGCTRWTFVAPYQGVQTRRTPHWKRRRDKEENQIITVSCSEQVAHCYFFFRYKLVKKNPIFSPVISIYLAEPVSGSFVLEGQKRTNTMMLDLNIVYSVAVK